MMRLFLCLQIVACSFLIAAEPEGAKDHPLVKRFEGSEIGRYLIKDYDEMKFTLGRVDFDYEKPAFKPYPQERKEGRRTSIIYVIPEGVSVLEVFRNYENALKAQGFTIEFQGSGEEGLDNGYDRFAEQTYKGTAPDDWFTPFTLSKDYRYFAAKKNRADGGEIWASLYAVMNSEWGSDEFPKGRALARLDVIETKAMGDRMVTVNAAEMAEKIDATGRVALYGILFDFNKTDIKPESKPALDQIAKLLTEDPGMKLLVVGHTDNAGTFEFNRDLSARRAAAVVAALTGDYGIPTERLFPFGVSFAAPVASNSSEEGRAKNRRVELVKY